jgi:hypothetical protein
MKPPIFSMRPTGDKAQQYLHRARMFRDAAIKLPDYSNGEQYWPKYALLTHAIELSLKAFAHNSVQNGKPPGQEPKQHDLRRVNRTRCPHARARGARRFQRAVRPSCAEQTDRLEPAVGLLVDVALSF